MRYALADLPSKNFGILYIKGKALTHQVWIKHERNDEWQELSPKESQTLFNHSPDGFNWGYGGSGPAQLALALLLATGMEPKKAVTWHQRLKTDVVAQLPQNKDFEIKWHYIRWLNLQAKKVK